MKNTLKKLLVSVLSLSLLVGTAAVTAFAEEPYTNGINADGYYVYYITEKDLDPDTEIISIDTGEISDAITERKFSGSTSWMPGSSEKAKVKLVNTLGYEIELTDWEAYTPKTDAVAGDHETTTGTGAIGADGNVIPLGLNPIRTGNKAVCDLYGYNSIAKVTLMDLLLLEDKIQEVYGAQGITTYTQYICYYYGVDSLSELTSQQVSEVFNGQTWVKLGNMDGYTGNEPIFEYAYQKSNTEYWCLETDKELVELGYNYFYLDMLVGFTFDDTVSQLDPSSSTGLVGYGLSYYFDQSSKAWQEANDLLSSIILGPTGSETDTFVFDNMVFCLSGPLMGNSYQNREVPLFIGFTLKMEQVEEIPDDDPPLVGPTDPEEEIPDEEVPLAPPATGDNTMAIVMGSVLIAAAAGAVLVRRRAK